jgi:hypothetical protein
MSVVLAVLTGSGIIVIVAPSTFAFFTATSLAIGVPRVTLSSSPLAA